MLMLHRQLSVLLTKPTGRPLPRFIAAPTAAADVYWTPAGTDAEIGIGFSGRSRLPSGPYFLGRPLFFFIGSAATNPTTAASGKAAAGPTTTPAGAATGGAATTAGEAEAATAAGAIPPISLAGFSSLTNPAVRGDNGGR
ncbi:hypothetical protein BHE74_00009224 [Ensete ventricosum]|nr:hypothetical protein GW17_00027932 [Ensete ventricosum]RWW82312.1 hypothetical protein BHE74_00009224 [Ensete ventricosum]RZR96215.1 hypothetical protein BHM03_00025188 [Ensete ventricosum]